MPVSELTLPGATPPLHERKFVIQYHETDQYGFVRHVALLNFMQTAGVEHAALMNVSVAALRKNGCTWVLSRVHLTMERYLRGGDVITIRTWPASRIPFFTVRDFELCTGDGTVVGRATTSWAVLHMKSRRPVRLDEVLPEFTLIPRRAIDDDFSTLPTLEVPEHELVLPVLRGDLDSNRHVNNTVYGAWALETIPDEVDRDFRLASLEIGFRAEALYGDVIRSRIMRSPELPCCFIHRIENAADGRELARLRTRWVLKS